MTDDIRIQQQGAAAVVTLTRAKALNALTIAMRREIAQLLPQLSRDPMTYALVIQADGDRAFSAGGDVREFIELAKTDMAAARAGFAAEYTLNWQQECFSKPTISLINGIVMGSGVGISAYGTHRVGGENYRFAMPETAIGLFPDVGVCYLLARLSDHIGMYLGLTGRRLSRAAAYDLGLLTHCIPSTEFGAIIAEISDAEPVDPALDERHQDPGTSELGPYRSVIAECFSAPRVEDILVRLRGVAGPHRDWAAKVAGELEQKSPTALKVTHKHIRAAKTLDLRQTLIGDYRLVCRFLQGSDFGEGVRAALVDKDNAPNWQPASLEEVTSRQLTDYFSEAPGGDLNLPTRDEMQAARS
jgi:enoyl-CoA hydratase/carnithine racemase